MNFPKILKRFNINYTSGKDRIVLIINFLGIVIKFPKNKIGNRVNFGEWYFWRKTHHEFCQPTIFCFGLYALNTKKRYWITIQKIGFRPCKTNQEEFGIKCSLLTKRVSESDGHHFDDVSNFFFNKKNKLVMVDYGGRQTRRVIKIYGSRIHRDFDENLRCTIDDLIEMINTLEGICLNHKH